MARKVRQIAVDGVLEYVVELDFNITREDWNEYSLLDGGVVRAKATVIGIFVKTDAEGNALTDAEGMPFTSVKHRLDVVRRS